MCIVSLICCLYIVNARASCFICYVYRESLWYDTWEFIIFNVNVFVFLFVNFKVRELMEIIPFFHYIMCKVLQGCESSDFNRISDFFAFHKIPFSDFHSVWMHWKAHFFRHFKLFQIFSSQMLSHPCFWWSYYFFFLKLLLLFFFFFFFGGGGYNTMDFFILNCLLNCSWHPVR